MADIKITDYKRFRDGIEPQYKTLLEEKKKNLETLEDQNKKSYEKICYTWAEYEMLCEVYGVTSQKAEDISDVIDKLIRAYDGQDIQTKIDELKAEIEWLERKIQV